MKIELVPSSMADNGNGHHQFLTSFLINDTLAVDAGSLGLFRAPDDQKRVKHILLSHSHIDHLASLPIFVENAYQAKRDCVIVHGSEAVLYCLRHDIFNNRVWPDLISLSTADAPFLQLQALEPGRPVELEGLKILPIEVNHVVPTLGFIIEQKDTAVIIVGDTGPTEAIWEQANQTPNLKAVFLEVTFPNAMTWLAEVSKHLTPAMFAREIQKLHRETAIFAVHVKAGFRDQVLAEMKALALPHVQIARFGTSYDFG